MNTINTSAIEKYAEKRGFILAKKIDDNAGIVIKPRKWWIPKFLYNAVIRNSVEIAQCQALYDSAYHVRPQ